MADTIIEYLCKQATLRIIRGLLISSKPRHIRQMASSYGLSPAGVSSIIGRLNRQGVLKETRIGNRRCFTLKISNAERESLNSLFSSLEKLLIEKRAKKLSRHSKAKLGWMDETQEFYAAIKSSKS
jgi:hypothetical protein